MKYNLAGIVNAKGKVEWYDGKKPEKNTFVFVGEYEQKDIDAAEERAKRLEKIFNDIK
jgi:hypothetical protein